MLTVKHIGMVGEEVIYAVFSVELRTAASKDARKEAQAVGNKDTVIAFTVDHYVVCEFDSGTVFVMNERGTTVSRYDLGPSPVVHIGGAPIGDGDMPDAFPLRS